MATMTKERLDEIDEAWNLFGEPGGIDELLSAARDSIRYREALIAIEKRCQPSSYGMGADVTVIARAALEGK